jgi:hypothetical protein
MKHISKPHLLLLLSVATLFSKLSLGDNLALLSSNDNPPIPFLFNNLLAGLISSPAPATIPRFVALLSSGSGATVVS